MFYDCKELVVPPILPATDLHFDCYKEMFAGCIKLSAIPNLPAENLVS